MKYNLTKFFSLLRDNFSKTKLLATYLRTVENRSSLIAKRSVKTVVLLFKFDHFATFFFEARQAI